MFDSWLKLPAHHYLYLTALTILFVGVSLSNVLMSIGTIWLIANWLLEGDFKTKLKRFKNDKIVWVFTAFFLFSLLSILWSENTEYAFHDIRIKLPFIVIPLVIGTTKPIEKKEILFLFYVFIVGLLFTSIFNYVNYNLSDYFELDIRHMSYFISHVRLAVLINIGIAICLYLGFKKILNPMLIIGIISWFIFYLFQSQTLIGYLLFIILLVYSVSYWVFQSNKKVLQYGYLLLFFGTLTLMLLWINSILTESNTSQNEDFSKLEFYTINGNPYYHDTLSTQTENGNYVWLYISLDEMEKEWNKKSMMPYDSLDKKNQPLYGTLFRYMTSKNLRKDSLDFAQLTEQDIKNIENGRTNYIINKGLTEKINELKDNYYMYKNDGDPNGHSFLQRMEHFKTAISIIQKNGLLGVGIGDVNLSFDREYEENNSKLNVENRMRSHNQFLTIFISHGVLGFILTILLFILPFFRKNQFIFITNFIVIALLFSFISEDTIETQAGVTIFSLFYSFFVLGLEKLNPQ